ncbi:hypothetical protein [Mariniflexile sp. AS56]|nr:hypothetical protein [Mariniflexile sp. AS56]MDO7172478.1 hypothetical protein [Mariniflexile sp. AS56]
MKSINIIEFLVENRWEESYIYFNIDYYGISSTFLPNDLLLKLEL